MNKVRIYYGTLLVIALVLFKSIVLVRFGLFRRFHRDILCKYPGELIRRSIGIPFLKRDKFELNVSLGVKSLLIIVNHGQLKVLVTVTSK